MRFINKGYSHIFYTNYSTTVQTINFDARSYTSSSITSSLLGL